MATNVEHRERPMALSTKRAEGGTARRIEFHLPREQAHVLGPSVLSQLQKTGSVTFASNPHDSPHVHPVDAFATRLGRLIDNRMVRTTIYVLGTGFLIVFFVLV